MFVSSYSTYISTNPSQRTDKSRSEGEKSFSSLIPKTLDVNSVKFSNLAIPVDYISKSQAFSNQLELELQKRELNNQDKNGLGETKKSITEFSNTKMIQNFKQAYSDNSKIFSLFKIPHATQDQTPKIDKKLPDDVQEIAKQALRDAMLNTYIQNDRYYQLTA